VIVRFCPRCGRRVRRHREDGYWRARCPACGWTYYGNPVAAAGAVIVRGARVLLVRRGRAPYKGTWDIPGGFVEAGENAEAALRRELREELGVTARTLRFVGSASDRYGPRGIPILSLVFRATVRGTMHPTDDIASLEWFDRGRIPWQDIAFPALRDLLRHHLSRRPSEAGRSPLRARDSSRQARAGSSRP
jgi:ADP-ribose pyrophosphatase YjhB (NUDIX family)